MESPRRARDFDEAIALLRSAGERLIRRGLDLPQRLRTLRGLFYGTPFSVDFEKRGSRLRNLGFNCYLQSLPPHDPTPWLGPGLVRALKDSAELRDAHRALDLGHVLVGLEARVRLRTRGLRVPTQGGTGLELGTWLGDLGGAAGLLAIARIDAPRTRVRSLLFSPRNYDLRLNLEGDLAGYLVARDRSARAVSPPAWSGFRTVADALQAYLHGRGPEADWPRRYRLFAAMIGGQVQGARLGNAGELQSRLGRRVAVFASSYVAYRLRHLGRLKRGQVLAAAQHLEGAAQELVAVFMDFMEQGLRGPLAALPTVPDLNPSRPQAGPAALRWFGALCPG
ncbi:MAG TPA: hypothetical protein VNZ67_06400 [bacterium]|jgi:hypothetical protein|nr:hypothetical protein [bacterium]